MDRGTGRAPSPAIAARRARVYGPFLALLIEEKGINRLDGDVTAGFNFTRASEVSRLQLGLDLHSSVGGGGGRILKQTNSVNLTLEGGLLFSKERFTGSQPNESSLEAFGTLTWDWFRYDTPELDLSTTLQVIPNLSDTGRVRSEFEIDFKWEII